MTGGSARSDALSVSEYAGDASEWDSFVRRAPGGGVFHRIGWKQVLEDVFGFAAHYLIARRAGEVAAVLPLFELHAPFMERCLLSVPFAAEAGVCSVDPEASRALERAALERGAARAVRRIELRDGCDAPGFRFLEGRYYRFRRALHADDDANFAALPAKRRNMIRQSLRHGLAVYADASDVAVFHDLYARTARRFGTPVFPPRFFHAVLSRFGDDAVLLIVRRGSTPVAGALAFLFGDTVMPYYVGSHRAFFRYAINDFLYWQIMRYAVARRMRVFDFGRSKVGTGAYEFKRLWGCDAEPLRYRVALMGDATAIQRSSADAGIAWMQRVWRRLPLPLTKLLGPFIVSRYGAYYT